MRYPRPPPAQVDVRVSWHRMLYNACMPNETAGALKSAKARVCGGLRGAGKTTLGRALAKALRRPLIELDQEIERDAGMSLS